MNRFFCNNVKVFIATFDQCNASLLNESIHFFWTVVYICICSLWCWFFSFLTAFWSCDNCRVSERWVQGCVTCLHSCVKYRCAQTDRRSRMWSVCGVPRHSSVWSVTHFLCSAIYCHWKALASAATSCLRWVSSLWFWWWVEHVATEASLYEKNKSKKNSR